MYKTVIKYLLIICAVLILGQLDINQRQLGSYFTSGLKAFAGWTASRLAENPLFAKIAHPKGLDQWFPFGEMSRKKSPVREIRAGLGGQEDIEDGDVEEDEESLAEPDEFSVNEIEPEPKPDDAAVMAILP